MSGFHLTKDVIGNTVRAISNLTFLGERLELDFDFCTISVKNSTFQCKFKDCFLSEMKMKFREKYDMKGTVKDIWSKSWTVPVKKPPKGKKQTMEEMYHQYTQDMFTVKQTHISK